MHRYPCAIAIGLIVVANHSESLTAQAAATVESNAPERIVAGCYAVSSNLSARAVVLRPGETPHVYAVPDTVNLTLHLDHVGVVYSGRTWREQGWFLRVRPDPWIGFHTGAYWQLADSARRLKVVWPLETEVLGDQRLGWSQTILATQVGDEFVGTVVRRRETGTLDSSAVALRKVTCPREKYFDVGRWWRALRMYPY